MRKEFPWPGGDWQPEPIRYYKMNMAVLSFHLIPRAVHPRWAGLVGTMVALFFVWTAPVAGQEYSAQNWHIEDGLPDEEINAITQTHAFLLAPGRGAVLDRL